MRLRTLGGLELQPGPIHRPKPFLLLAYLALEGAKERRHLCNLFWPDAADPAASLRAVLHYLHKLGKLVASDQHRLRATPEVDAVLFLEALEHERYDHAHSLYSGVFLENITLGWGAELEEWVYSTREFLTRKHQDALIALAEGAVQRGDRKRATRYADAAYKEAKATGSAPETLERLYGLLVVGNSPYAAEVRREAEEFGLTLTRAETQRAPPLPLSATRHNLPLRSTSFVGRDAERTELSKRLAQADGRLITLQGAGGVGKTRLALHVALEQLELGRFRDGVYFVALETVTSVQAIPNAIAAVVGVALQGHRDPLEQLQTHLASKDALLILDNFEHLVAAALLPLRLIRACPALRLLVTTRERLNLNEEWVFDLGGLPLPPSTVSAAEEVEPYGAVQLFTQRARRARRDFALSATTVADVLRICRLSQGFPLALELAATWTTLLSCREIADEMANSLDLLTTTTRDVPERHKSIRAAFAHSWSLLSPEAQTVFARLAVFRGGVSARSGGGGRGGDHPYADLAGR